MANQLTSFASSLNGVADSSAALDYDAGGNLTQITNDNGAKTLYTYDDNDRLTRVESRPVAGTPPRATEWVYDYAGRKVVSRELSYTAGAWSKTGETRRVYDEMDVVQERNDQNQVTAQYTRDGNIGGILARTSASGQSYFHYDGGGNVTALSDENGALVGRYSYDAFGNTLEASGARAAENPYRFSTKEHIAGMVDYGYRFYLPGMGRWLNRDPIRDAGGINLYGMIDNNPINFVDAYGLIKFTLPNGGKMSDGKKNEIKKAVRDALANENVRKALDNIKIDSGKFGKIISDEEVIITFTSGSGGASGSTGGGGRMHVTIHGTATAVDIAGVILHESVHEHDYGTGEKPVGGPGFDCPYGCGRHWPDGVGDKTWETRAEFIRHKAFPSIDRKAVVEKEPEVRIITPGSR